MQISGVEECCGLLLAHPSSPPGHIDRIFPAANVAANRRIRFEIDPATLIRAHRAERDGQHRIIGCYHSHPGGNAAPSTEDAAQAQPNGWLWLICAGAEMTAWRSVEHGAVHGRFDALPLAALPDASNFSGENRP